MGKTIGQADALTTGAGALSLNFDLGGLGIRRVGIHQIEGDFSRLDLATP